MAQTKKGDHSAKTRPIGTELKLRGRENYGGFNKKVGMNSEGDNRGEF